MPSYIADATGADAASLPLRRHSTLRLPAHLRTARHQIPDGLKLLELSDLCVALSALTQARRRLLSFCYKLIELRFCTRVGNNMRHVRLLTLLFLRACNCQHSAGTMGPSLMRKHR